MLVMLRAEGGLLETVLSDEDESNIDDEVLELVLADAPSNAAAVVLELELSDTPVDVVFAIDVVLVELLELQPLELTIEELVSGLRKKNMTARGRDRILRKFVHLEFSPVSPDFRAISLLNTHKTWRKQKKSTGENSKNPLETAG